MFEKVKSLFAKAPRGTSVPRRIRPTLEALGDRVVPAIVSGGVLYIDGTNGNDITVVSRSASAVQVYENGVNTFFPLAQVNFNRVEYRGYAGDDWFVNSTGFLTTAYGMGGDDMLMGGTNADQLFGGIGNDTLQGDDGDDLIAGEDGNDHIIAGRGNDRVTGAYHGWSGEFEGNDIIEGGDGHDTLSGGDGDDRIIGGNGSDLILGERGNDQIWGAFVNGEAEIDGHDHVYGGDGDDVIHGGYGNDLLVGEGGHDSLYGETGNDKLMGAYVAWSWEGGSGGNDYIHGGNGDNELWGGDGNDVMITWSGYDYLNGEAGNDLMYAGAGVDMALGGAGRDTILGEADDDYLDGEAGNDLVDGGGGDDYVHGGDNDDWVFGGNGRDHVYGDAGRDLVSGGSCDFSGDVPTPLGNIGDWNHDFLEGGAGKDYFLVGDQVTPFWWLDSVRDATSEDEVWKDRWGPNLFKNIPPVPGHLYGVYP